MTRAEILRNTEHEWLNPFAATLGLPVALGIIGIVGGIVGIVQAFRVRSHNA
jgi:uncharacterized membrane protein HdeD (DUF308 family)